MIIDSHVHTHYSHGDSEVYRMVMEAIKRQIQNLGFSEHFHYDYMTDLGRPTVGGKPVDGTLFDDFKLYYRAVEQAKLDFADKIDIRVGVEVDFVESKADDIKATLVVKPFLHDYKEKNPDRQFEFDFIMGATHFIGQPLKYFSDYKSQGDDWLIDEYFKSVEDCVKSGLFDIIAHPEMIKYFVDKDFEDYRPRVVTLVNLMVQYGVAIDVNTDYLKNPVTKLVEPERLNPGIEMLKLCHEKNVPLVLGSDAHAPGKLAENFDVAINVLKGIGATKLYYFKNRELVEYDIA